MASKDMGFMEWCTREASEETCQRYEKLRDCKDLCNSWCYKARLKWLRYLMFVEKISPQEYLLEVERLRLEKRACPRRKRGARQYDPRLERIVVEPSLEPLYRAAAESGVRVRHLWLLVGLEPSIYQDGVLVFDVRAVFGQKRVNVIAVRYRTLSALLPLLSSTTYDAARKRVARAGATPLGLMRKIHWNICLALCDRELCQFIEGRRALVDDVYYTRYLEASAECTSRILPYIDRVLGGEPLSSVYRTLPRKK